MATLLADLLATTTEDDVLALLIGAAQTRGLQTTDWEEGSPELTIMEMVAEVVNDLVTSGRPVVVSGGFVDLANTGWLTLNAHERYNLERTAAIATVGELELTVATGTGPYTLAAGTMVFLSASGLRYTGPATGTTINTAQNGSAGNTISITAEVADASYNVPADTITVIATPLPGVTCTNAESAFSDVVCDGTSQGTIVPSAPGVLTPSDATWIVLITTSGQRGTAEYQLSSDGGASFGAVHTSPIGGTATNVDTTGLTLTWTNNGTVTPSFVAGDRFTFTTPGVWYTTTGSDEETNDELVARCKARWPSLADVPVADKYELWALAASPNVRQVRATANPSIAATVTVVIAGDGAIVTNAEKTAVEDYIEPRTPISDIVTVTLATAQNIALSGATVTVKLSLSTLIQAQVDAQAAYESLISDYRIADTVRWAECLQALMDCTGIVDCTGLLINGATTNVVLSSTQIAHASSTLLSSLTWAVIP